MDGKATKLVKYLDGSDKRFIIPVYQRNYSWKIENCRQLYDDLVKLIKNDRDMHFFGSLVSVNNGKFEEYLIIDGQQRVTTISLLLLAIHNILKEGKLEANDRKLIDKVYNKYLVDEYDTSERRIKLKAVNKDLDAFERLFEGDPSEYLPNSDITINYNYFYERILKEEISVDELFEAIKKLTVINITVDEDDDPQLIFESLNSTGVDLTEGDKIRNYILMGQTPENQEEFYKKYWSKIEICTGNDKNNNNGVSLFIRDYLSVMRQSTPSMDKIYPVFKGYVLEKNISIEDLLVDLLEYARYYETIIKSSFSDDIVNASIRRLNYLETTVSRPFFLQVFHLYKKLEVLTVQDLREIFGIVENYLFRRNICEVPTNALNKVFLTLNREIHRYDGTYDNYVEKMKYALLSKKESGRFPNDDEFRVSLSEKQVYLMRGHFKNYLFERFENYDTEEVKDVFARIENGKYTIEHIMPQTLTPAWRKELGDEYEEIHTTWLHRLANLTLTAYNSSYSNNPFVDKRDADNGFKKSGIRMNQLIAQNDKWTLAELEERDAYMVAEAVNIWSYPYTDYQPEEKQLDAVSLDDDINLTGSQIAKFSYKGTEQTVESWTDMYARVLRLLHTEDSSVLTNLAYNSSSFGELAIHVSSSPEEFTAKAQIAPNLYVWTGTATQYKINTLKRFFMAYNTDPSELIFYLKDKSDKTLEDKPERYALRKKYWTFALPQIKEKFGESGPFSKSNPCTANWLAGFFGIGGFNINCAVKFNGARIQFWLGKTDKNKNKEAFDYLYSRRGQIEEVFGDKLIWSRQDEYISSYVTYELPGVSIADERDWIRIAKFHAEYAKKMCDAMLPILKEIYPYTELTN